MASKDVVFNYFKAELYYVTKFVIYASCSVNNYAVLFYVCIQIQRFDQ